MSRPTRCARSVYPRVCGGTFPISLTGWSWPRSIPACAGEPRCKHWACYQFLVYPRVCGGTGYGLADGRGTGGLSPRVRGNRRVRQQLPRNRRSIPACAGEPAGGNAVAGVIAVYPRVCGGTLANLSAVARRWGLSPRVRGNRGRGQRPRDRSRSIPACAGEPRVAPSPIPQTRVYPRVCGGTTSRRERCISATGLSPRVRGNLRCGQASGLRFRSIPACAGEPTGGCGKCLARRVYPRVCGGTPHLRATSPAWYGLSPRVRGNPRAFNQRAAAAGSIPACAGEPQHCHCPHRAGRVYPRVCGGTRSLRLAT